MHKGLIIGWLVLALGAPAGAQEQPGTRSLLAAQGRGAEAEGRAGRGGAARARPAARPGPGEGGAAVASSGGALFGERDVALGDRVKAVQRKGFLKRGRFEVAPILALSVNDAFYQKVGGGLRLAYSLQDSFALARARRLLHAVPHRQRPRSASWPSRASCSPRRSTRRP